MAVWIVLLAAGAPCAEEPIIPYTVCEIAGDLMKFQGNPVAALGRYSFREDGRWLGEQTCGGSAEAAQLRLNEDDKEGPRAPGTFEIDAVTLNRKFTDLRKHTALGKFRFGSPDYDRWAVVYGRVETRKGEDAKKAAADLVFRGDGVVVFLTP